MIFLRIHRFLNPTSKFRMQSIERRFFFSKVGRGALMALWMVELISCGKVGPPLPPEVLVPKPITDLASAQVGHEIKLTWTLPTLNTNGSKATTIQRIEVYRQIQPSTEPPPKAEQILNQFRGSKVISIDMTHLDAFTERGRVIFVDKFPGISPETLSSNRFSYAVKVLNKKRQEAGFSNVVIRQYLPVPPPIPHIDFKAEETKIILTWSAPPSGIALAGYNVYRSDQGKLHPPTLLNTAPVQDTRFEDQNFQFGTTYSYTVRSVVKRDTVTAESFDSPEFAFKPIDVFPPKTPTGLTVVFAEGKINLLWDTNLESDFAGYNAYRSEDGSTFKKINDSLLKSPTFRDGKIQRDNRYFYRVTAVDTSGNESPPSEVVPGVAESPH